MLPAQNRMRSSTDFSVAVRSGRRVGGQSLVVHHVRSKRDRRRGSEAVPFDAPLVGLVVSKAVGSSVVRHRVSRRLRALLSARLHQLPPASSTVVRALRPAADASSAQLARELDRALTRLVGSG